MLQSRAVRTSCPSWVTATVCSNCAERDPSAVTTVHPSGMTAASPSWSSREADGIPCTISSFTDAQIVAGNGLMDAPRYPLKEGLAPCSAMYSSAIRSKSSVVVPGPTTSSTRLIVPATIRPAVRILSSSSGDFRMIMGSLASDRIPERAEHAFGDGVQRSLRVHLAEQSALRVVALERFGLLPIEREAPFDSQFVLIAALLQGGPIDVTDQIVGRRPPLLMVRALTDRARVATDDAPDCRPVRDRELHDRRERCPQLYERDLQRLGLADGTRESIQDETLGGVGLSEPLLHHTHDDVVRDVLAPVHVGPRFDPQAGAFLHMLAQRVSRRDLGDVEALREDPGLCPLAGAGESEEHEAHRALPRYRRKPS